MKKKKVLSFFLSVVVLLQIAILPINATDITNRGSAYIFISKDSDNDSYGIAYQIIIEDYIEKLNYGYNFSNNDYGTTIYNAIKTNELVIVDPLTSGKGYIKNFGPNFANTFITGCNRNTALSNVTHTGSVYMNSTSGVSDKVNRLTVYLGSYTAVTPDPIPDSSQIGGYYYPVNLLNATYMRLSKCVVGWQSSFGEGFTDSWTQAFTCHIAEKTIAESLSIVSGFMFREFGTIPGEGYASYFCRGDSTQIIGD